MLSINDVTDQEYVAKYKFLRDITVQAMSGTEPGRFVSDSLTRLIALCGAVGGRLVAKDFVSGAGTKGLSKGDQSIYEFVMENGPVRFTDIRSVSAALSAAKMPKSTRSILANPLVVNDEHIGVLWLAFGDGVLAEDVDYDLIKIVGYQIGLVLASRKLLRSRVDGQGTVEAMMAGWATATLWVDTNLSVKYLNPAAEKLFGVGVEDVAGYKIQEVMESHNLENFLVEPGNNSSGYIDLGNKNYQILVSDMHSGPKKSGYLVMLSDVTDLRRVNENMTLFLQTVSHDLRSPLTAAKGFVDMMPMVGELNDRQLMMKDKILTSIIDMTNLVEKVLDAGRLDPEMGAYKLIRETCDPVSVVEKVVSTLTEAARKKSLSLDSHIGDGVPVMNLDEMMLERSLLNLVENAVKYTPEGGRIVVSAAVEDGKLILAVDDDGLGIPPDDLAHLFDRGSRVRRDEFKSVRGSGLGLFIVKNVAQQHGGKASVESVEGEGSSFRIVIPIAGLNVVGAS